MPTSDPAEKLRHPSGSRRGWLVDCSKRVLALGLAFASAGADAADAPAPSRADRILIVGDSLSAEYGLARGTGWVALLQARLAARPAKVEVVNASISGDTTAGGRTRLPVLLEREHPTIVVIELGANDALRGLPIAISRDNLAAMVRMCRAVGARVLLAGMQLPPNYGRRYGADFTAMYAEVAKEERTALVPFFLHGVADVAEAESLFQADRIHPLATAHPIILGNVWPVLEPMLKR